jgi:hypothetical protein
MNLLHWQITLTGQQPKSASAILPVFICIQSASASSQSASATELTTGLKRKGALNFGHEKPKGRVAHHNGEG